MHSLSVSFVERFCVLLLQHSQIQCESALDGLSKLCALATPFRPTLSSVLMSGLGEHVLTRANSSASLSVSLGHIRLAASSLLLSRPHPCRPPFFAPLCFLLLLSFRLFPFSPQPSPLSVLPDKCGANGTRASSTPDLYAFSYSSTN